MSGWAVPSSTFRKKLFEMANGVDDDFQFFPVGVGQYPVSQIDNPLGMLTKKF